MKSEMVLLLEQRIIEVKKIWSDPSCFPLKDLSEIAEKFVSTFSTGKKVAFVGNGGSAAESIHLTAEFIGKCVIDHNPLPVLCLNESQSVITAVGNDYDFDQIFARMVKAHLREGDLLVALSTSGKSKNILEALKVAIEMKVSCMLWMGSFETNIPSVTVYKAPSISTPRIQEIHLAWGHVIAEVIERNMNLTSS